MEPKKRKRIEVIAQVAMGQISRRVAAMLLGKSRRTIDRYLSFYRRGDVRFFQHGNTGKRPINKSPEEVTEKIQELIKTKYPDYNLTHLREVLLEKENIKIGRETLRKLAHEIHHVKRAKRKRRTVRRRRERASSPGLLLQLDGSTHRWFGKEKCCLMGIIDDANSELHAEFFPAETTDACMKLLKDLIKKKGVFEILYVDRAGLYAGHKRARFSQVQRACEELGITIMYANSPEGKGRIERAFDTLQDRLIPELRNQGITDMESANHFLQNSFLPGYWNTRLTVETKGESSFYTPIKKGLDLDGILTRKHLRKVGRDQTFSFRNQHYSIETDLGFSLANRSVELREDSENTLKVFFGERELEIKKVVRASKKPLVVGERQQQENERRAGDKRQGSKGTKGRKGKRKKEDIASLNESVPKRVLPKMLEKLVVDCTLGNPEFIKEDVRRYLWRNFRIKISTRSVHVIWLRYGLDSLEKRKKRIESDHSLQAAA